MIVDASAVVAILREEPVAEELLDLVDGTDALGIGSPSLVEAGLVLTGRLGISGRTLLARFVQESGIDVEPFTEEHWSVALDAFARYGKGHHPAALNFGDCMSYATSRIAGRPLLCVGDDFPKTDLPLVGDVRTPTK